ncbi:MAG: sulfotransferase family protein [Rhodospirillaceae bacterium]
MRIIGAGFGRTGTNSMKLALEHLGYGPCYHMKEVFEHPESIPLWHKAAFGDGVEWDDILADYESGVDWPLSHFWETLSQRYSDAKVLLTIRPASEWYTSMSNTIFSHIAGHQPGNEMQKMWKEMVDKIVRSDTFDNRTMDRAYCEAVFDGHTAHVKDTVSADRLIVYEVGSGWEPLCEALGVAVPEGPFPKTNTTKDFQDQIKE